MKINTAFRYFSRDSAALIAIWAFEGYCVSGLAPCRKQLLKIFFGQGLSGSVIWEEDKNRRN